MACINPREGGWLCRPCYLCLPHPWSAQLAGGLSKLSMPRPWGSGLHAQRSFKLSAKGGDGQMWTSGPLGSTSGKKIHSQDQVCSDYSLDSFQAGLCHPSDPRSTAAQERGGQNFRQSKLAQKNLVHRHTQTSGGQALTFSRMTVKTHFLKDRSISDCFSHLTQSKNILL